MSATSTVVLETVVVVPFTTRFPVIVAFPPTVALPLTAKLPRVPTEVKLDAVTPLARVAPVNVPAAAVTVISAEPSNATPFISTVAASFVAVAALPVVF